MQNPSNAPIYISIFSVFISMISLYITHNSTKHNKSNNLRNVISTYVDSFISLIETDGFSGDFFTEDGFKKISPTNQRKVEIVNGLLVAVIDVMHEINDPRAKSWAGYLDGIPGPISNNYPLETYSSNKKTIKYINELRDRIQRNKN